MDWITISDIKSWPKLKNRQCQDTLPELVSRLVLAHTVTGLEEFRFPSGDGVSSGGWDGRLKTPITFPYFPAGVSAWEMSSESSIKAKANKDFLKRSKGPKDVDPSESTFVFVTPQSFDKRDSWINEKRKEKSNKWKDIKVIAASELEQWIRLTPAVGLWLARKLGKLPINGEKVIDIEFIWDEWSAGATPAITPELVISGRTNDRDYIQKWLGESPAIIEVQGDDTDEVYAFLYSVIATLPGADRGQALSRCVYVDNLWAMRTIINTFVCPLIIVCPEECEKAARLARDKGHHVFIAKDATSISSIGNIHRLSRPKREEVETILHGGGLSKTDADRIARDFGRSIPVLHRHIVASGTPDWVNSDASRVLLPALFANAWNENKKSDCDLIEVLTGKDYKIFIDKLTPFLSVDDAPLRKVGSVWMIKSPLDAWYLLAPYLSQDQLNLFEKALLATLTKTDPKYELEPDKRWMASIYGKENPYSEWLRTGLVESLSLFAVFGDKSPKIASTQSFADHIVEEIFANADTWEAWASLKDTTPLLAEASPEKFMHAVEEKLKSSPKLFQQLMGDDSGIFGECRHSGLLWALEGLAWSPDNITRSVNVLAELSDIDSGGRWANRPLGSLRNIFLPGFPQTHVKPAERIEVLKQLAARFPNITWQFVSDYYDSLSFTESHRLRWRDTGGHRRGHEREGSDEHQEYMQGLLPIMEELTCDRKNILSSLGIFIRLSPFVRKKLLSTIESLGPSTLSKEESASLLAEVRDRLNWIKSYGEENFSDDIAPLERILSKFEPSDVIERVGWIVATPSPTLPQGDPKDYYDREELIKVEQKKAARAILDEADIGSIFEFASKVKYPGNFGYSLGVAVNNVKEDHKILESAIKHSHEMSYFFVGYAQGRINVVGPAWVDQQIEYLKKRETYTPELCALMYMGLPEGLETWKKIGLEGQEEENAYWKRASGYSRLDKDADAPLAVEKLLNAKRPLIALKIAGDPKVNISSDLLQRLIQELLDTKDSGLNSDSMNTFYLGHVFNQLYQKNELSIQEMVHLEWPFALVFEEMQRYISAPMAIHRALQTDPQFFAQLVSFIYKGDDNSEPPSNERIDKKIIENRAQLARKILDSWYLIPGKEDNGSIDEEGFNKWIEAARERCEKTKHTIGCDIQIGNLLAHAPADPADGKWPHIAVRNLIEKLNNQTINEHIRVEIFNSRGVVSRGLGDGGRQERELAEKYRNIYDALKVRWPRTASILRELAEGYESEAKREDIDSELRDLR